MNLLPDGKAIHTDWIRVTYRDTDKMGLVYYANYLVWLEIGRTEVLRQLGQTYLAWEEDLGVFLPVSKCEIEYHIGARYDDLIHVATTVSKFSRAGITFEYQIFRENNVLLATAKTSHCFTDREGRIVRRGEELLPFLLAKPNDAAVGLV